MRCFFLLLYFSFHICFGQTHFTNTDSLLKELPKAKNDTIKARLYIKIAGNLKQSDPEKALSYHFLGLDLVKKMKWNKGLAAFYNDIGSVYFDQNKFVMALENFKLSINYSIDYPNLRAISLSNISDLYISQRDLNLALTYINLTMKLAESENLASVKADCFSKYGQIYTLQNDSVEATLFYQKAYQLYVEEANLEKQATVLSQLGGIANSIEHTLDYYQKAKKIWDSVNPGYVLAVSNLLGIVDAQIIVLQRDSLAHLNNRVALMTMVETYINEAIKYSMQSQSQQNLMYAYGKMAELKELQGDYKAALNYGNKNYELYASIFSIEKQNQIAAIENREKMLAKDSEIAIKKVIIEQNEKQKWFYIIGILLLAIIGTLLFNQSRNRKKTNQQLLLLNADLERSNRTKNLFFSILNHDLRNPVSNIIDLLQIQNTNPELLDANSSKRLNQTILSGAENLLGNMEDLLLWCKGQMEYFKPNHVKINLQDFFEATKEYFKTTQHLRFIYENQIQIFITTDENYLKTIVRNIIFNAIQAMQQTKEPIITFETKEEKEYISLSFTDCGPGINQDQLKTLFDDSANFGIKNGLGLHLIRDLAKAIDCEIIVSSIVGKGTKFTLKLPTRFAN